MKFFLLIMLNLLFLFFSFAYFQSENQKDNSNHELIKAQEKLIKTLDKNNQDLIKEKIELKEENVRLTLLCETLKKSEKIQPAVESEPSLISSEYIHDENDELSEKNRADRDSFLEDIGFSGYSKKNILSPIKSNRQDFYHSEGALTVEISVKSEFRNKPHVFMLYVDKNSLSKDKINLRKIFLDDHEYKKGNYLYRCHFTVYTGREDEHDAVIFFVTEDNFSVTIHQNTESYSF